MSDPHIDQLEAELTDLKSQITQGVNLGAWWTWTFAEFDAWCVANLMTDAEVDATTLNAALKKNVKAINAFVRNGGKMLIVARDVIKWLIRNLI